MRVTVDERAKGGKMLENTTREVESVMVDITAPAQGVDVDWSNDRKVLWVNVDGICVLRICQIPLLVIPYSNPDGEEDGMEVKE